MATTIQIKRSPNVAAATTTDLLEGELAYSYDKSGNGADAKLYIEVQDSGGNEYIHTIGGKYYTSKVDSATSANTISTLVARDALGNFSANTITANSFVGDITASQANKLTTGRYINLSGDLQGNVLFDGSQNVTIVANVISNSVTLGTDTVGDYVANLTAGTGVTLTGQAGESSNITVALATSGVTANTYGSTTTVPVITVDTYGRVTSAANATIAHGLNIYGNSGVIAIATNGSGSLELTGGAGITSNASGSKVEFDLRTSGVTANTYGGTTNIPVFTVDTYGRITSASNASISTSFNLAADSGSSDTFNSGDTLRIAGGGGGISTAVTDNTITVTNLGVTGVATGYGLSTTAANGSITLNNTGVTKLTGSGGVAVDASSGNVTITNLGVTSITGTANQITVSASNASVQISLPNDVIINRDLSVSGNLYVTGNVVSLPVETLVIEDPLIQLANTNVSTDIVDIGFFGSYGPGDASSHYHTGLFRDASDGKYRLFQGLTVPPTTTVDIAGNNYSIASLVANLTGGTISGLTSNIAVGDGGTGRGTFTTNGILYGNAAGALKVTSAGTYGQVLQAGSDGTPVYGGIDGGTY